MTDQQLQKNSTERIREVLDRLRGIEPPKPEPDDPDKLNLRIFFQAYNFVAPTKLLSGMAFSIAATIS